MKYFVLKNEETIGTVYGDNYKAALENAKQQYKTKNGEAITVELHTSEYDERGRDRQDERRRKD